MIFSYGSQRQNFTKLLFVWDPSINLSINQSFLLVFLLRSQLAKKKAQQLENAICKITEIVRTFVLIG